MKRLCLILAYLFLFTQTASAMPLLVGQKVVYRGTITGLRIGAADGGDGSVFKALVDNLPAAIINLVNANPGGLEIQIYDSSNRMLRGVLKAVGTGETVTDLVTGDNSTFASDTGWWSKGTGWTINDAVAGKANHAGTSNSYLTRDNILTQYALYKFTADVNGSVTLRYIDYYPSYTSGTLYVTTYQSGNRFAISTTIDGLTVDNVSLQKVLTPSSSGATIVSAKGGEVYNFSYRNASFSYNSSSYYVIIRAIR